MGVVSGHVDIKVNPTIGEFWTVMRCFNVKVKEPS